MLFFPEWCKIALIFAFKARNMLYVKQRLRKYGIESAVTFEKSRTRFKNPENDKKMSLFVYIKVDFAIIDS